MDRVHFRGKGEVYCPFHPGQKVALQCKDCSGTLVCTFCITSIHRGHVFLEINHRDTIKEKTKNIRAFIQNSESEIIPKLLQDMNKAERKMNENNRKYTEAVEKVKQQGERLKKEVDRLTVYNVALLDSELKENYKELQNYISHLQSIRAYLERKSEDCKAVIQTGSDILIFDTQSEIEQTPAIEIPEPPEFLKTLSFQPCMNPENFIQNAFGEMAEQIRECGINVVNANKCAVKRFQHVVLSPSKIRDTNSAKSLKSSANSCRTKKSSRKGVQLDPPIILSEFGTTYAIQNMCLTPDDAAWVCDTFKCTVSNYLDLIDYEGTVQKRLKLGVSVKRICIDPTTGALYCTCSKDRGIRRINIVNGSTNVMFDVDAIPGPIACTRGGSLAVGLHDYRMCIYSPRGRKLGTYPLENNKLHGIVVCFETNRIALLCEENGVLVLNHKLHEMFRYKGQPRNVGQDRWRFECVCAVFDDNRDLLVGDSYNQEIHVLCGNTGQLKRSIHVDGVVLSIGVHVDLTLWVGCRDQNKFVRIKYQE